MVEDIIELKWQVVEQVKVLEMFEKQNCFYELIIFIMLDLVYVFNFDYIFVYVNKVLFQMWGKMVEEVIGKGFCENGYEEWYVQMYECEIDVVVEDYRIICGMVFFLYVELGSWVYDYIFGLVLNEKGQVEVIVGIICDIMDIKNVEEKFL